MNISLWTCQDGQGGYDIGAGDVTLVSVADIAERDGARVAALYRQQQGADFDPRALAMLFKAAPQMLAALQLCLDRTDIASDELGDVIRQAIAAATPTGGKADAPPIEGTGTKYTVIDPSSGEAIDSGLTAAEAAHIILTDDGRQYEIREDPDGGFTLWSRQQVANKPWSPTVVFSIETEREKAETEIFQKVIVADWPRHPEAITDQRYQEMLANLEAAEH